MAKFQAIEWDANELRVVEGRSRGGGISVDRAQAIPLPEGSTTEEVGGALKDVIGSNKGVETLVAIPRSAVEARQLQLPLAPDDELPDMVRFQAMRQFSNIGEDWPLDYVELERDDEGVQVLASVIPPESFSEVKTVCETAEQSVNHICLRPFATAALVKSHVADEHLCRLIVDMHGKSADLSVMDRGQVIFMRTVRLPESAEVPVQGLMGEIRRTIAAASNQMGGRKVEAVTLLGTADRLSTLQNAVEAQLKLDTEVWNPFDATSGGFEVEGDPSRYSALLGMMATQASGVRQPVDFLNPRRPPKPKSNRERYLFYTFLALVTVTVLAVGTYLMLEQKDKRIAALGQERADSEKKVEVAQRLQDKANLVALFELESVEFLDELQEVSVALPPDPNRARVQMLSGDLRNQKGEIKMNLQVSEANLIDEIEDSLQGEDRTVDGDDQKQNENDSQFPWSWRTTTKIDLVERAKARTAAEATTTESESDDAESDESANGESTDDESTDDESTDDESAQDDGATADDSVPEDSVPEDSPADDGTPESDNDGDDTSDDQPDDGKDDSGEQDDSGDESPATEDDDASDGEVDRTEDDGRIASSDSGETTSTE